VSTNKQKIWEQYTSAWKAERASDKLRILSECLDESATYCDPMVETNSINTLADYMVDFHTQMPGGHFVTTYFLDHHDTSITRWNMVSGDGDIVGEGISHGRYGSDGKLITMTGFFETPGS
jgi:hypothetical protein